MKKFFSFTLQAVTVGLAAAFVLLMLQPYFGPDSPVVTIQEVFTPASELANGQTSRGNGPVSYADAVAAAAPAVVNIHTAKMVTQRDHPVLSQLFGDAFGAPRKHLETSLGSGVIFSAEGYLLTNNHVIEGADEIRVLLEDGRSSSVQLIGTDPETDLAVLKLDLDDLPSIKLGQSDDMRVGDVVLAIGNPFGVGQTVTMGIVSATGRQNLGINTFENFIQTDAAINPGNSGGALVNAYGHLVGINTAIFSKSGGSQGIGFAIPVKLASDVLTQLVEKGRVIRGWIGVEIQAITPVLAESFGLENIAGAIVAGVLRGGPADSAGLKPGDIITHVDGEQVGSVKHTLAQITRVHPGEATRLTLIRAGKPIEVEVTVAQRPTNLG